MVAKHPLSLPGIYRITRTSDGKVYIGQTKRKAHTRWTEHKRELNKGMHRNWPLQEAWLRGTPGDFEWHLVCEPLPGFSAEDLTYLEVEVLKNYPNHFNLNEPIQVYLGAHASTRAKYSAIRLEMWADPEFKAKRVAALRELQADPTFRAKQRAGMRAFYDTAESTVIRKAGGVKASLTWANDAGLQEREGVRRKELWADPAHRTKQTASRSASWKNPESRAKRLAGLQGAWDRLTPEERAERSAKMLAGKKSTPEERSAAVRLGWEVRRAKAAAGQVPKPRKSRSPKPTAEPINDLEAWWDARLGPEDDGEVL